MLSLYDPTLQNEDIFSGPALDQEDLCDHCDGDGFVCKNCGAGENHCTCGGVDKADGTEICDWCFGEG